MRLEDGSGKGNSLKIDDKLRARTFSVVEVEDRSINIQNGKVWSLKVETTPTGANDYFFYLKNTGTTALAITDIRFMCAAAETIHIEKVSGDPSYTAASDVTPISRNLGSSRIPTATIKQDTDITSLSSEGEVFFERADTPNKLEHLRTSSNIIIPQGTSIAIKAATGTNLITAIISLVELEDVKS